VEPCWQPPAANWTSPACPGADRPGEHCGDPDQERGEAGHDQQREPELHAAQAHQAAEEPDRSAGGDRRPQRAPDRAVVGDLGARCVRIPGRAHRRTVAGRRGRSSGHAVTGRPLRCPYPGPGTLCPCPAGVAQLAAHPTCNRAVGGSSPPVGSGFQLRVYSSRLTSRTGMCATLCAISPTAPSPCAQRPPGQARERRVSTCPGSG
jgi:hypothetical protein